MIESQSHCCPANLHTFTIRVCAMHLVILYMGVRIYSYDRIVYKGHVRLKEHESGNFRFKMGNWYAHFDMSIYQRMREIVRLNEMPIDEFIVCTQNSLRIQWARELAQMDIMKFVLLYEIVQLSHFKLTSKFQSDIHRGRMKSRGCA